MTVVRMLWGLKDTHRLQIAEILHNSFSEKLEKIFGPTEKAIPVLSKALRSDRIVLALIEDTVTGIAGLKFDGKDYLDLGFWFLLKNYKLNALKVIFNGMILESKIKDNELCLDTLAVASNMRGIGIGTQLVEEVLTFARDNGKTCVKLWVVNTNSLAKKLYERLGFKETSYDKIPFPWSRIFHLNGASEMTYEL